MDAKLFCLNSRECEFCRDTELCRDAEDKTLGESIYVHGTDSN